MPLLKGEIGRRRKRFRTPAHVGLWWQVRGPTLCAAVQRARRRASSSSTSSSTRSKRKRGLNDTDAPEAHGSIRLGEKTKRSESGHARATLVRNDDQAEMGDRGEIQPQVLVLKRRTLRAERVLLRQDLAVGAAVI
jgi:hypothetical protein